MGLGATLVPVDLRRLWHGVETRHGATTDLHDSSLESLILSTALQSQSVLSARWKVPASYRGAQLLADLCAQLPWATFDGGHNSGARAQAVPRVREELPTVLVRPDPFRSRGDFLREIVLSLVWWGNAYILRESISEGLPTALRVLDPATVLVDQVEGRRQPRYRIGETVIPNDRIDHIALNRLPGQLVGIGPFQAADETIAGQRFADQFARDLFAHSGIPTGMISHPGKLTQDEAKALLEGWETGQDGRRKTAVMGGGVTYDPIGLSPDEGQLLQSRSFGVSEIARVLGIPSHLLQAATGVAGASGSSLTYTNLSGILTEFVRQTLFPVYLTRIEEVASSWVPRGQSVRFDLTDYLRADEAQRFNAHETALRSGFLTVDEIRAREGLEPLPASATPPEEGSPDADSEGVAQPIGS